MTRRLLEGEVHVGVLLAREPSVKFTHIPGLDDLSAKTRRRLRARIESSVWRIEESSRITWHMGHNRGALREPVSWAVLVEVNREDALAIADHHVDSVLLCTEVLRKSKWLPVDEDLGAPGLLKINIQELELRGFAPFHVLNLLAHPCLAQLQAHITAIETGRWVHADLTIGLTVPVGDDKIPRRRSASNDTGRGLR